MILAGAAIIQAVAALVIIYLTRQLARSTNTYATVTRTQFDREWQPNLHLTLFSEGSATRLRIVNLSRNAVVVTHLFIHIEGTTEEWGQFDLNIPLPGLVERESGDLTAHINEVIQPYVQEHAWSGGLTLRVGFLLARVPRPSEPVSYRAAVKNGYVSELKIERSKILWNPSTLEPLD